MVADGLDLGRFRPDINRVHGSPEPPWDVTRVVAMLDSLLVKAGAAFPPGAYDWAQEWRPDLLFAVREAEHGVDAACDARDLAAVRVATVAYGRALRALFVAFEAASAEQLGLTGV